jgi:hypothetical protein
MQVEMAEDQHTRDAQRRERDALIAQTEELLSTSEEFRRRIDRKVAEAMRRLDRALLQMRRGY